MSIFFASDFIRYWSFLEFLIACNVASNNKTLNCWLVSFVAPKNDLLLSLRQLKQFRIFNGQLHGSVFILAIDRIAHELNCSKLIY